MPWFEASAATLHPLIAKRNTALDAHHRQPSPMTALWLREARATLQTALRRAQSEWVMAQCAPVNEGIVGSAGSAVAWAKVKTLKSGLGPSSRPPQPMMRKRDGTRATTSEENASVFAEHFEKLYGHEASYDPSVIDLLPQRGVVPDLEHPPSDEEIRHAVKRLNDTAPGKSGVAAPLFKALITTAAGFDLVCSMALSFWETGKVPDDWETGLLAILPKKGDLSDAGNYRGIMMLEVAYKIIANLIHARIEPVVEALDQEARGSAGRCGLDHETQCGFRRKRGCSDAIFTIRQLIAKRREHGLETWILFLDLVKAFDRVPRTLLWKILQKYGVPPKIVDLLIALHETVHVEFEVDGVVKSLLSIIGVKQGDLLGPQLFTFLIAAVMETWRATHNYDLCAFRSRDDFQLTGRQPSASGDDFNVSDSEYADDTGMPFQSRTDVEEQSPKVVVHFGRWGMEVHVGIDDGAVKKDSKTEILFAAARSHVYADPTTFDGAGLSNVLLPDGRFFSIVAMFKYLSGATSRALATTRSTSTAALPPQARPLGRCVAASSLRPTSTSWPNAPCMRGSS